MGRKHIQPIVDGHIPPGVFRHAAPLADVRFGAHLGKHGPARHAQRLFHAGGVFLQGFFLAQRAQRACIPGLVARRVGLPGQEYFVKAVIRVCKNLFKQRAQPDGGKANHPPAARAVHHRENRGPYLLGILLKGPFVQNDKVCRKAARRARAG